MAGEWERVTIASLLESGAITGHKDGNHGSQYPRVDEFGSTGVPFLTAKSLSDGKVDIDGAPRLADDRADKLRLGFVQSGDVLLSHNATIGRVGIVPVFNGRLLIGTSLTYFRLDESRIFPRYLASYFAGTDFQNQLVAVMSHTTRNQVPITAQRRLKIVLPPLAEQKAIAHILGTLDDKIELNRRMNETLEAMARAIFKSWFVDFDPVRAKAEGRNPGLPKPIADLFPDSFEDSELGKIPKGWQTLPLYDTAEYVNGLAFRQQDFCDSDLGLPIIKIAELKNGIDDQTKRTCKDSDSSCLIDTGDLLYSWSGSPDTSLDVFVWTLGPGWLNQHIFKVNTPSDAEKTFVYYFLRHLRPVLVEIARNKQTTGLGHVTVADMKRLSIAYPPQRVREAFQWQAGPLFSQSFQNQLQNRALATLRDTLLPKLLSGEIRVADALPMPRR
jgi:type I restriction enzyme S subunit